MNALEQIQQLDRQRLKIIEDQKLLSLSAATAALEPLNALGYHFCIVENKGSKSTKKALKPLSGLCKNL